MIDGTDFTVPSIVWFPRGRRTVRANLHRYNYSQTVVIRCRTALPRSQALVCISYDQQIDVAEDILRGEDQVASVQQRIHLSRHPVKTDGVAKASTSEHPFCY